MAAEEASSAEEVRRRVGKDVDGDSKSKAAVESDNVEVDSDFDEKCPEEKLVEGLTKKLGNLATEAKPSPLDGVLSGLPPKWRNYLIRFIFTWLMIGGFFFLIYMGPLALMIITLMVQVKCFTEIINIGYAVYRVHGLPWFRSISWYFLIASNYFFYGESLVDYFGVLVNKTELLHALVTYHRFISFSLYIVGFCWFVLSLVKKYYMRQFFLFAWTHIALLICVTQSYLIIQNVFEGLIWFVIPVSMIICNDIWAYMFGFFFGKTPLIKLSPKKTWEGFIGGGVATIIFGCLAAHFLGRYQFFVCPIQYSEEMEKMILECEPSRLFQLTEYQFPGFLRSICSILGLRKSVYLYPFMWHSISLSMFASIIGPFGGFFASGFKRAFRIKDFGDVIPGHGGILDRFDCQFLMATFVNVYISSFIRAPSPQKLLHEILKLKPEDQLTLFSSFQGLLMQRGLLPPLP